MIIGITGEYERGKKEILSVLLKNGFSYEPLPRDFKDYYPTEKELYFEQIGKKGNIVVDELTEINSLKDFQSKENFYLFGARMPLSVKFFYEAKKKLGKKDEGWEYYETFVKRTKEETKEISSCLDCANKVFNYNSKTRSLEKEITEAYEDLL